MDFQFWLYLIIAVVYILSRALKKQESQPQNDAPAPKRERYQETSNPQTEQPRQLTFEELLREITEAKQPPKPVYQAPREAEVVDYDDVIAEEEQDLETIEPDYGKNDKLYDIYEEAKRQAFVRPSLEETMNIRDTVMEFGKFKAFEQEKQRNLLEEYTKDLKDPQGLKKAFVLTEILNRKF
jgi:hypothetical protein